MTHEHVWLSVEPTHCHQRWINNTLVEKVRFVFDKKNHFEILHRFVPEALPFFFFDHEIDHLPGMLEISAARQGAVAVSHLLYDDH